MTEAQSLLSSLTPGKAPSWSMRYRLGVLLNRDMDPTCTLEQIAAEFGITKQNAYTETVLALGNFACLLQLTMQMAPQDRAAFLARRPPASLRLSGTRTRNGKCKRAA